MSDPLARLLVAIYPEAADRASGAAGLIRLVGDGHDLSPLLARAAALRGAGACSPHPPADSTPLPATIPTGPLRPAREADHE